MVKEESPEGEVNDLQVSADHQEDDKFHRHTGDGASPGKIFIGGLAKETTSVQFTKHFGKYGELTDSVIMKDRKTGQPRGFGFVTYADATVVDKVIQDNHVINGKQVEIKRTIPKGSVSSKDFKTKKIFVGGIPTSVTEDEFKDFFTKFGEVKEHMIMRDHATSRSRGFGFITFEEEQAVDDILANGNKIDFAGSQVEIKKAEPKKSNSGPLPPQKRYSDTRSSYGAGAGDSYGGYGGGVGGGGFGASSYRSGGAFGGRPGGGYGGYSGSDYGGGYGGYGGAAAAAGAGGGYGAYRGGESSLGYSGRYGGGYGRGYDLGAGYGGPADAYGGYGAAAGSYGAGAGSYGAGAGSSYGGSYDSGLGGAYGGGSGGPSYGSRGGYGGAAGGGRYHPYAR